MFAKLKNKIKKKKSLIKMDVEKFDSIQEKFTRQIIGKRESTTDYDKRVLYPNEIYNTVEINELLKLEEYSEIAEVYVNDYFDIDFLYFKIEDDFEELTGKKTRYDKYSEDGYITNNKVRIKVKNVIFKPNYFSEFESLIELERLQKTLGKSTQKLKSYMNDIIKQEKSGELFLQELSEEGKYRKYHNKVINDLNRILKILDELINIRKEKQSKIKSLIIPIFSLIIPILIFFPDYMNFKEKEDYNIYKLNNWEQIAYNEALEELNFNDFKLVLSEKDNSLDINKDYIDVIIKNEEMENKKNDRAKRRLLVAKILFSIFLIISLIIIYFVF